MLLYNRPVLSKNKGGIGTVLEGMEKSMLKLDGE
jgi:hypothetical protein